MDFVKDSAWPTAGCHMSPRPSKLMGCHDSFGLNGVVLTGDKGMITAAKIGELGELGWVEWLAALRNKELQVLAKQGLIQHSLSDGTELVEFTALDYPTDV